MDIDRIDYTDPSLATDPYRHLDYLAAQQPVYREPHHGVVMVTGHEEAITVLRQPDVFSSATLIVGPDPWKLLPERPDGDDITEFVNAHREYLPQNDQIVTADPPSHTAQRALLMGLITPKRLKENEEFIWRLTDRQLDYILPLGTAEINADYAQPYTLLVIADLLGVPEEDHAMLLERRGLSQMPGTRPGGVTAREPAARTTGHNTLEVFYDYFSEKIAERRERPLNDVLTGMAQSLFPDGSVPEPIEVARIASNLFAAGQETTVRLIATALRRIAEEPETQAQLRANRDLFPGSSRRCCGPRARSWASTGWRSRRPSSAGCTSRPAPRSSCRTGPPTATRASSSARPSSARPGRTCAATSPSATASTPARGRRWPGRRRASRSSGCSNGRPTSASTRKRTAPRAATATTT